MDYILVKDDYDYDTIIHEDDKWVLIEDMKIFQTSLQPPHRLIPGKAMDCEFYQKRIVDFGNHISLIDKAIEAHPETTR